MKRKSSKKNQKALWGARFKKELAEEARIFSYSLACDGALLEADIRVSVAHATMLTKCRLLTKKEGGAIVRGLQSVLSALRKESLAHLVHEYEDVHTLIQERLENTIGPLARKLHMGRSRNDLVVTSTRLFTKENILDLLASIELLQKALVGQADKNKKVLIPGYTHLQRAQVVGLAQHFLAYAEMFERDRERLEDAKDRLDELPLGAAALAGTSLAIDRRYTQKLLRFQRISENSMDAVSDRDFMIEVIAATAILFMHLSRLSEDLILWNTTEFGFITLSDAYATGSSLMPQKKNPDMLELVRGKTGAIYGHLISLLVTMKGLPLTYNRDMQEDKWPLFASLMEAKRSLRITAGVIRTMVVDKTAAASAVCDDGLFATDLADYLVVKGVPFKDAHEAVGQLILAAEKRGKRLSELHLSEFKRVHAKFSSDVKRLFSAAHSVSMKKSLGSTAPKSIASQITKWRKRLRAHS